MSGLLRRITRPGAAEEPRTEPISLSAPAHGSAPTSADGERAPAAGPPLPAGAAPEDVEQRRAIGRRGKLRRRARYLRRARELALRDLGGLVYEARRRQQDGGALVEEKVKRLAAVDAELRTLEAELGTPRGETVLREPGVGGTCPRCGELHGADARYCSSCGLDLTAAPERDAPADQAAADRTPADRPAATAGDTARGDRPAAAADTARGDRPAATAADTAPQAGNGRAATRTADPPDPPDRPA